ncbi:MAG: UbiA family prenyltransferase, partial [Bacteroidales bacterium]|nr:UbiA family prenyltransferase [Bacteroidales bacterium]
LSFLALVFLLGYSYLKRFTWLCHFGVGAALCIAPAGAYIAVTGHLSVAAALLSLVVFFWSSGFDILYALADEEIDREQELHSIPQRFGRKQAMDIAKYVHLTELLLVPSFLAQAGLTDFWGILAGIFFLAMLVYQHTIISPKDLSRLNPLSLRPTASRRWFSAYSSIFPSCFDGARSLVQTGNHLVGAFGAGCDGAQDGFVVLVDGG